jgi:hypothetical protein
MLEDLYDSASLIFSHWWPRAQGEITEVGIERIPSGTGGRDTVRLAVAYKFLVGNDGPYTGESFWNPPRFTNKKIIAARHNLRRRQAVIVRYRPDDPSVNRLASSVWRSL